MTEWGSACHPVSSLSRFSVCLTEGSTASPQSLMIKEDADNVDESSPQTSL